MEIVNDKAPLKPTPCLLNKTKAIQVIATGQPATGGLLTTLSLSMLLSSLGASSANVAMPALGQAFNASFQQIQWIVLAYLLAITTLIVSVGRLGDIFGRRRLLLTGMFSFTFASLVCGLAPSLSILIAARAIQGLGAAIMMTLAMVFASQVAPGAKAGRTMGLLGTMSALGTALGPSLGGLLLSGFSWRAIFFVNVPLGLLTFIIAFRSLPPDRPRNTNDQSRFDYLGTFLLFLTLMSYALSMTIGRGHFRSLNAALILMAACGLALFLFTESKVKTPLIQIALFRNARFSASLAMSSLVSAVVMTGLVVGPFYLAYGLQLNPAMVGVVLSIGPIVAALTGIPAGRFADRFTPPRMVIIGLIGMASGTIALSTLPATLGLLGYIVPTMIVTASYAVFQAANNTAIMFGIDPTQRGVISGLLNLSRNLGLITGASVMGAVFTFASTATDIQTATPETIANAMRITFSVAAGLTLISLSLAIGTRPKNSVAKSHVMQPSLT